jgi:hypothetical protein
VRNGLLVLLLATYVVLAAGCQTTFAPRQTYVIGHWDLPSPNYAQVDVQVETATRFTCAGQQCRLLGVREFDDPAVRAKALDFTVNWFKKNENRVYFENETKPLKDADGTCVVWLGGHGMRYYGWLLNSELVYQGLVEPDLAPWDGYNFTVETKVAGTEEVDWRGALSNAVAERRRPDTARYRVR